MRHGCIILLRIDQSVQNLDGVVLVPADTAIEDLLLAGLGVEVPGALVVLNDRNGHRPVVSADVEGNGLVRLHHHAMHLFVTANKVGSHLLVGDIVSGMNIGPELEPRIALMAWLSLDFTAL